MQWLGHSGVLVIFEASVRYFIIFSSTYASANRYHDRTPKATAADMSMLMRMRVIVHVYTADLWPEQRKQYQMPEIVDTVLTCPTTKNA